MIVDDSFNDHSRMITNYQALSLAIINYHEWPAVIMAVRRVSSLSVILLSFSLLALFSVNLYSLKLSKNAQVHYGDNFFKYFNSYPVNFNLISPRHRYGSAANLSTHLTRSFRSQEWRTIRTVRLPSTRLLFLWLEVETFILIQHLTDNVTRLVNQPSAMTVLVKNARSVIGRLLEITVQPYATAARCGLTLNAAVWPQSNI